MKVLRILGPFKGSALFTSAGAYTANNLLNSAIPFLLLPVMTRFLNPTDYGILAMYGVIGGIFAPFIIMGTYGSLARAYYDSDQIDLPAYISNCLFVIAGGVILVSGAVVLFARPISRMASFPSGWLWSAVVVAAGLAVANINLTSWQVRGKPFLYGLFQVGNTALNNVVAVVLIVVLHYKWQGKIMADIMAGLIFAFISLLVIHENFGLRTQIRWDYVKQILRFGIPLIPHALGGFLITMTDRIFITRMVGLHDTGLYALGAQIGLLIGLLADSFNKAWVPWLYQRLKSGEHEEKARIVKLTYWYNLCIISLAAGMALSIPPFFKLFIGHAFQGSSRFVIWLAVGYAFHGMYLMVANYIFYARKTHLLTAVTLATALMNIVLNYFLIRMNGAIGAAQATAIAYLAGYLGTWLLSARVYKMPWNLVLKRHKERA